MTTSPAAALELVPSLDEGQRKRLLDWAYRAVGDSRERGYAEFRSRLPYSTHQNRWVEILGEAANVGGRCRIVAEVA